MAEADTDADLMDGEDIPAYSVPALTGHPAEIYHRLVKLPEFQHLNGEEPPIIEWMFRNDEVIRGGRRILGTVHIPRVQGALAGFFTWMLIERFGGLPDFLVALDNRYWQEASDIEREILVYHEMSHMDIKLDKFGFPKIDRETMRPTFCLRGHDIEEFNAVVRRYGAHSADVRAFLAAVADGEAGVAGNS